MKLDLYTTVTTFLSQADLFFIFLLFSFLMLAITVIEIFVSRRFLAVNKHLVHLGFSLGVVSIQTAFSVINAIAQTLPERLLFPLLLSGVCLVLYAVVLLFPKNPPIIKDEHLDFVKFLDGAIKPQIPTPITTQPVTPERKSDCQVEKLKAKPNCDIKPCSDIDFTHVKNVAERLNYYNLSVADRRIVTELLTAVAQAENGDFTNELRSRINDYLGTLLKLMAKYGV